MSRRDWGLFLAGVFQKVSGTVLVVCAIASRDISFMLFAIPVGLVMVATRRKLF